MDRIKSVKNIRNKIKNNQVSIGSWMQISNPTIAEIMGNSFFEWIAIDQEHGHFSNHQLPDIFRALELTNTLPLVRLRDSSMVSCKEVLDAGAGGVIVPMVESSDQLERIKSYSRWPPSGCRGVGFSRSNMFGKNFSNYALEAQSPLLIAMVETKKGIDNIDKILTVKGLDAIMLGPYDLSASLGITADFENTKFKNAIRLFLEKTKEYNIPSGTHVVNPDNNELNKSILEGYKFIAYSIDSVFLRKAMDFKI